MSRGKNSRRTQKNLAKTTVVAQEKKVEEKTAAEPVKETVQPVKKEEVKPVAKKTETVKTEPVKAITVKTEKKVQPTESKPAAKATEKPVAKTTAKETKATAKTTKKTTTRKAAKKPVEKITEVYFEYNGEQILSEELVGRIQEAYKNEGHRISSIKTLRVYINPDERKAYYVINDKAEGKFVEF